MIVKFFSFFLRKKCCKLKKTYAAQNDSEMGKNGRKNIQETTCKNNQNKPSQNENEGCVDLAICPSKCKYTARFFLIKKQGEMVACGVCVVRCLQKSSMYFSFCLFRHFNLTLSITKLAMHLDREMALPALMIFVCIQKLISQRHITLCFEGKVIN